MADKVTTENVLQMKAEFVDGDERTISVEDPNDDINLGAAVYSLQSYLQNHSVIIGDKGGAAFSQFRYANNVIKTKTELDLS